MKKIMLFVAGLLLATGVFAEKINPKNGYLYGIKWGMTTKEVNRKLPEDVSIRKYNFDRGSQFKDYKNNVTIYYSSSISEDSALDDKMMFWYFLDGKLFQINERLKKSWASEEKLKERYEGIYATTTKDGKKAFWDRSVASDGKISMSVTATILQQDGTVIVNLVDFERYKQAVTFEVKEYDTNAANASGDSIVGGLKSLAEKLVQTSTTKPTYAFIALASDDGNALVENYVTDALTEAMFETGKIKIVERASIEKIMSEQKFQSSALVNENTAVEIGNLSGANYVCYGTVKDLGTQITLNVKVVEVSTAELCAMGRETIGKDTYLGSVGFEKRGGGSAGNSGSAVPNVKKVANNQWKVETVRNDFDECTVYTFTVTTPEKYMILVGLKKYDNPMYSSAFCGVGREFSEYSAEIKSSDGKITKTSLKDWVNWYLNGHDGNYYKTFGMGTNGKGTKFFFDICLSNDTVAIRDTNSKIGRFQTAGLEEKIIEAGLTVDDFLKAYSNESF